MTRIIGGGDQGEPLSITANKYTNAVVGELVKRDTSGANKWAACADGDTMVGRVKTLGAGTDVMGVDVFGAHWIAHLPFVGAGMDVGDSVVASATVGAVKAAAAAANASEVVGVDVPTGFVDVRFKSSL